MNCPDISIIVPAFNEENRIGNSLREIVNYLETNRLCYELIVVNDGSSDSTALTVEREFSRLGLNNKAQLISYEQNQGKGFAVRRGLTAASGSISVFSDADLSAPISEITKLIEPIRNKLADITIGSRAIDRRLIETHQSWLREQGGKFFNLLVRLSTGLPFWDTQCGFKAFRTEFIKPALNVARIDRFGFDVELLVIAYQAKLKIKEIPVRWGHCEGSKVNFSRDVRKMFGEVLTIRRNLRKGLYSEAVEKVKPLIEQTV